MPGDLLGDAVLDLQPRVHLEEEVARRPSPGTRRCRRPRSRPSRRAAIAASERSSERAREARRRRLLDHLLVAALHRAVAAAEREHDAVLVGGDLHLDVAPALDPAPRRRGAPSPKAASASAAAERNAAASASGLVDDADAAAAAARAWPSRPPGSRSARRASRACSGVGDRARRSRAMTGTPAVSASCFGGDLVAERAHRRRPTGPRKRMPSAAQALDEDRDPRRRSPSPARPRRRRPRRSASSRPSWSR